jgi:hypothetical protein
VDDMEIWKDIPGYEGKYQVSNLARIKSCKFTFTRSNGYQYTQSERIKKLSLGLNGYLFFNSGKCRPYYVHRAVALCFVENKNKKIYNTVDHLDENKLNNNPSNLQWVNQSENAKRWIANNIWLITGENNAGSILKEPDVVKIKDILDCSMDKKSRYELCKKIAKEYKVHPTTIGDIYARRTWKHVGR